MMARPAAPRNGVVLASMDFQTEVRELRHRTAPLFEAAMATGDWNLVAETKALADLLRMAQRQARRIAGLAEGIACADGIASPGHGAAA